MSVTGLCQICEAREARFACERCGAVVCQEHYDADLGLCQSCATETRRARDDGERRRRDDDPDVAGPR
ncbi:MAG: hypothetical protein ABEJ80_07480 [Halarchaeum sp.]